MWEIFFPEWLLEAVNFIFINGIRIFIHSTVILSIGIILAYAFKKMGASVQSMILRTFLLATFLWIIITPFISKEGFKKVVIEIPKVVSHQNKNISSHFSQPEKIISRFDSGKNIDFNNQSVLNDNNKATNDINKNTVNTKYSQHSYKELVFNNSYYSGYIKEKNKTKTIIYSIFALLWIIISSFFLLRLIVSLSSLYYMKLISKPSPLPVIEKCMTAATELNVKPPLILQNDLVKSPLIAGILKPAIFLPPGNYIINNSAYEVFLHELSHLKRNDNLWNLARHLATALIPFQPLLWIISRWLEEASDYSCDDYVIKHTTDRHRYANGLFNAAANYNPVWQEKVAGAGFVSLKSPLYRRIKRILDKSRIIRLETGKKFIVLVMIVCVLSVFSACFFTVKEKAFAAMNNKILIPVFDLASNNTAVYSLVTGAEKLFKSVNTGKYNENPSLKRLDTDSEVSDINRSISFNDVTYNETLISDVFIDNNKGHIFKSESTTFPNNETENSPALDNVKEKAFVSDNKALSEANGGFQPKLLIEKPIFIGNTALLTTGYRENKIRIPVAKALNVKLDFDYNNFEFDLNDQDDRQLYNLYRSLDKNKNEPAWSPDGKWIAFTDQNRVWLVSSDGGEPKLIFEETNKGYSVGNFESICFTSDSKEVTFKKDVYDETRGSIIDVIGAQYAVFSNPIPCIESVNINTLEYKLIVDEAYRCSWSRNGRYLCYLKWTSQTGPDASLYGLPMIFDKKTGEKRLLISDNSKRYGSPAFGPDDKYIVIPVRDGSGPIELFKIPLDGGQPEQFTKYSENDTNGKYLNFPEYSPDGKWILFTDFTWCEGKPDKRLFVYNTKKRDIYEVFPTAFYPNSYGKWSPDGTKICYLSEEKEGNSIYICDFFPESLSKPVNAETTKPIVFSLKGNFPNPFNSSTTIEFSIPETALVTLEIFNISGQKVREIINGRLTSGSHTAVWDGCNSRGERSASGVYISRVRYKNNFLTNRMTLLK